MIKLFSDGLMEKIHYRTNLNISGGAFQLKFKDIKRFVSELSQEFKIIPESNI